MGKLNYLMSTIAMVVSLFGFWNAAKADDQKNILAIISHLADRMYATGETAPSPENFENAINVARQKIRDLMATADLSLLTEKNQAGTTPLMLASYYGFAGIVEELLSHRQVQEQVNELDSKGGSAWVYANLALREAPWVCNPSMINDPFRMIPIAVQQPYYQSGTEPPYIKVRKMLEDAGSKHDMEEAKRQWASICKNQGAETQARAASSQDLLVFVREEGQAKLLAFMKDAASRKNQK